MCRKVEIFDKRMVLGVVVPQIVPQMMQFKKFHQYQIDMNAFGIGNLSSIHLAFRHLIDFLTVQHQVGCKSMNKRVKQAEKETGASPYIKRCGEYTVEVEFAGSGSLESCLAAYLNEKYRIT